MPIADRYVRQPQCETRISQVWFQSKSLLQFNDCVLVHSGPSEGCTEFCVSEWTLRVERYGFPQRCDSLVSLPQECACRPETDKRLCVRRIYRYCVLEICERSGVVR